MLIGQAKPSQREGKTKREERKGGSHYVCVCSQGNLGGGASFNVNKQALSSLQISCGLALQGVA